MNMIREDIKGLTDQYRFRTGDSRHPIIFFSLDARGYWWFRATKMERFGHREYLQKTPWLPAPTYEFTLPKGATRMKERARLPAMHPREWALDKSALAARLWLK